MPDRRVDRRAATIARQVLTLIDYAPHTWRRHFVHVLLNHLHRMKMLTVPMFETADGFDALHAIASALAAAPDSWPPLHRGQTLPAYWADIEREIARLLSAPGIATGKSLLNAPTRFENKIKFNGEPIDRTILRTDDIYPHQKKL